MNDSLVEFDLGGLVSSDILGDKSAGPLWKRSMIHFCCGLTALWLISLSAQASVIVVTNRAATVVVFRLIIDAVVPQEFTLVAGDCFPIQLASPARISFVSAGQRKEYRVAPKGLYYFFAARGGQLEVREIGLDTPDAGSGNEPNPNVIALRENAAPASQSMVVIPIKILFDDAEITTRAAWEARLRKRIGEASRLFKKYCFVEFQIVAIDSWQSDASVTRLDGALSEFERLVDPAPARLAIGFTGRQKGTPQDRHQGGTRGPFHTHVLIREWVNGNTEQERLEVLVHELGHFLGAVHSPELSSVMRAATGDRQARAAKFRIAFDPLNTLAMCLVSQELRSQPQVRFAEMQPSTRDQLRKIYSVLMRATPDDPTAAICLRALSDQNLKRPGPARP